MVLQRERREDREKERVKEIKRKRVSETETHTKGKAWQKDWDMDRAEDSEGCLCIQFNTFRQICYRYLYKVEIYTDTWYKWIGSGWGPCIHNAWGGGSKDRLRPRFMTYIYTRRGNKVSRCDMRQYVTIRNHPWILPRILLWKELRRYTAADI